MKLVKLDGIGEIQIRKSARAKRVILKINQSGQPVATIPSYLPYLAGERFVKQNQQWIQQNMPETTATLEHGKRIGKTHRLEFIPGDVARPISRVTTNAIRITYPKTQAITEKSIQIEATKAAERALRRQAETYLPKELRRLADIYGYSYSEVRIKAATTRWGSCSNKRIINLGIWLMQLPDELVEYVMCHELTHLNHMNHSKAFWNELSNLVPNYKALRTQLRQYHPRVL